MEVMRRSVGWLLAVAAIVIGASCGGSDATTACCTVGQSLRVVNAFNTPVQVLVDGQAVATLANGQIDTASVAPGSHTVALRAIAGGASPVQPITISAGGMSTIAAVRDAAGGVGAAVLDDTGSVVPAGKTKVRVLHLAPSAGVLQVYRTQPDYAQPVSWQFPFTYQSQVTPLNAPFYQSTPGMWEIRVWQSPADSSGWATAPVRVTIPLASGEKRTVMILDAPGGGVRVELI